MKKLCIILIGLSVILSCSLNDLHVKIDNKTEDSRSITSLGRGLVLEYLFDGNVEDTSGNMNHGEIRSESYVEFAGGVDDQSLMINDESDYVRPYVYIEDSESLHGLSESDLSIAYWFKSTSRENRTSGKSIAFNIADSSQGHLGDMPITGNQLLQIMHFIDYRGNITTEWLISIPGAKANAFVNSKNNLSRYQWHLFVFTVEWGDTEGMKLYIDGELSSKTDDPTNALAPFPDIVDYNIGGDSVWQAYNDVVGYDNFRLYNRALTSDEVEELYEYETNDPYVLIDENFYFSDYKSGKYFYANNNQDVVLWANTYPSGSTNGNVLLGGDSNVYLYGDSEYDLDIGKEDFDIILNLRTSMEGQSVLLDKMDGSSGYKISLNNGIPTLTLASRGNEISYTPEFVTTLLNDGAYHELSYNYLRKDSEGLCLYIDGELVESFDGSDFYRKSLSSDSVIHIGTDVEHTLYYSGYAEDLVIITY
ncbi:LamG-like jellyroll fold domain-containing protein [Spirochaeta cellobiosiphila]|uniref:LamG-like jellyroll fold domain-containing protein n=1 Tax=Spirochaeta cellobiosiphila TaxID=504483 RepID=UPI000404B310|nr:LamG-like jellyroll fold domain-containing protein [Spirochaeta cellobiosiphila]